MANTFGAVKFLFVGPLILVLLAVINVITWSGVWWVQWAALGIGIAWFANLFKVLRAAIVAGGLAVVGAALAGYLGNRSRP